MNWFAINILESLKHLEARYKQKTHIHWYTEVRSSFATMQIMEKSLVSGGCSSRQGLATISFQNAIWWMPWSRTWAILATSCIPASTTLRFFSAFSMLLACWQPHCMMEWLMKTSTSYASNYPSCVWLGLLGEQIKFLFPAWLSSGGCLKKTNVNYHNQFLNFRTSCNAL